MAAAVLSAVTSASEFATGKMPDTPPFDVVARLTVFNVAKAPWLAIPAAVLFAVTSA